MVNSKTREIESLGKYFMDAPENVPMDTEGEREGYSDRMTSRNNLGDCGNLVDSVSMKSQAVAGSEEEKRFLVPSDELRNVETTMETNSSNAGHETVGRFIEMGNKADAQRALVLKDDQATDESLRGEAIEREGLTNLECSNQSFTFDPMFDGDDSGTEEEQVAFMRELENFFKERQMEFKPPKFYGEGLNCLKLWRAVTRLGGYDTVTSSKLWRQVGESFKPPKTCTTVSWSFRIFYEKALLDYERHKVNGGELCVPIASPPEPTSVGNQMVGIQSSGSGRARRDAAARAMQGWHSQRLLGNGEVGDPIIKDKSAVSLAKRDKHNKSLSAIKRKKPSSIERVVKTARIKGAKQHDGQLSFPGSRMDAMVVDVGPSADWVKINVRPTKDCYEIYALVPGLLREEVRVQSDPAGRLVISGEPEQPDNPWGVTSFKKVISLPSRIDPHQTSAVVTLHGQLFVRAPFEQPDP